MGEVYAGLYILLVSKIIRRLINKKATKAQKVNGFLLDKNSGVIRCSIQFENFNLPLKVEIMVVLYPHAKYTSILRTFFKSPKL